MLIRIIKDWDSPDIFRQTPGTSGVWNDLRFTLEDVERCDFVIVLNKAPEDTAVVCPPRHIWAIMQEPYISGVHDWMVTGHESFGRVFTHHVISDDKKYVRHFPMLPWHVGRSYDELMAMDVPQKEMMISWITSNKTSFPGHKKRMDFLEHIRNSDLGVAVFGKGIAYIEDKWSGLAPFRYSLAIENSNSPDYWTEKLADCFLSYTLPLYYGCPNLETYFPEESFIRIDIMKPEEAVAKVRDAIENGEWEKRLEAIREARDLVLNRYNFFAQVECLVKSYRIQGEAPERRIIKQYKKAESVFAGLVRLGKQFLRKIVRKCTV
jgi:hypothetical protein